MIQALQGAALGHVQSATLAVIEAGHSFLTGDMNESDFQQAIHGCEAAWRGALLLAKTQIQDEEALYTSMKN